MKTNRNFQSTLRVPRAAFLDIVGSERGGTEVGTRTIFSEADEVGVAVRGTQKMSVVFVIVCAGRTSPVRVDRGSLEKAVEMSSASAACPREDVPSVELDPGVREFRTEKYAV